MTDVVVVDEEWEFPAKSLRLAERRHHYRRLKQRRVAQQCWGRGTESGGAWTEQQLGMAANTPKPCSSWCCGNHRQYEGPSLAEVRSQDVMNDGLRDYLEPANDRELPVTEPPQR